MTLRFSSPPLAHRMRFKFIHVLTRVKNISAQREAAKSEKKKIQPKAQKIHSISDTYSTHHGREINIIVVALGQTSRCMKRKWIEKFEIKWIVCHQWGRFQLKYAVLQTTTYIIHSIDWLYEDMYKKTSTWCDTLIKIYTYDRHTHTHTREYAIFFIIIYSMRGCLHD